MNETEVKSVQNVILDTNILGYSNSPSISTDLIKYISSLEERKFGIIISEISLYEVLKTIPRNKEEEAVKVLAKFPTYKIDDLVLTIAALLCTITVKSGIPSNQISTEDYIIAATAAVSGSLILTADVNDFPRPYFKEVEQFKLEYKEKNKTHLIVFLLLMADIDIILTEMNSRP